MVHLHLFLLTGDERRSPVSLERETCTQFSLEEQLSWGRPGCGMLGAFVRQKEVLNFLLQCAS